jgi:hypothetical protein
LQECGYMIAQNVEILWNGADFFGIKKYEGTVKEM